MAMRRGAAKGAKRFTLLLLEEEEDYVQDNVVSCRWPEAVSGNWQKVQHVPGRLRLCTKSIFFEPDDPRIPIVRLPFNGTQQLKEADGGDLAPSTAPDSQEQGDALRTQLLGHNSSSLSNISIVSGTKAAAIGRAGSAKHSNAAAAPAFALTSAVTADTGNTARSSSGSSSSSTSGTFCMACTRLVKMRMNMEEVPYVFESGTPHTWMFTLRYAPLDTFLGPARELWAVSKLPKMERCERLEELVRHHVDAAAFDSSRLVDFSERVLFSCAAVQLTPLVRERGHLLITTQRVYFQPLHNVAGDVPVRSHPLSLVAAVARRRSTLRPVGLELFFLDAATAAAAAAAAHDMSGISVASSSGQRHGPTWDAPSAFFAFRTEAEREQVVQILTNEPELGRAVPVTTAFHSPHSDSAAYAITQPVPALGTGSGGQAGMQSAHGSTSASHTEMRGLLLEAQGGWLGRVMGAWQHGRISNFEYLLFLNLAAGRSFNDLSQWPVVPWVLANYKKTVLDLNDPSHFRDLSKPVGALNPSRLREFRKRYQEMPTDSLEGNVPPFLYGTHYSTGGYVMYWLMRAAPAHMLRLQNGRFDAPDRMFNSMLESWECVNSSTTDVKELIPEFYLPNSDFLVNRLNLPLGQRQSGRPVEDVELPPWADGPDDFLAKHRAALESPHVSSQLHNWIDLIFGCKQRGPAAEAADNLFYYLTYEGAVDTSQVTDPMQLKALETQINEFGQTPRQLFTDPHPPRLTLPPPPPPALVFAAGVPACVVPGAHSSRCSSDLHSAKSRTEWALLSADKPYAARQPAVAAGAAPPSLTTADNDAGNRALALALMHTLLEAAAQYDSLPAPSASTTSSATLPAAGQHSLKQSDLDTLTSLPSAVACTHLGSPFKQEVTSPSHTFASPPQSLSLPLASSPFLSSAPTTGASSLAPAGPTAANRTSSSGGSSATLFGFSSFLKLGRYQQRQQSGAGSATAAMPSSTAAAPGVSGAAAGTAAGTSKTASGGLHVAAMERTASPVIDGSASSSASSAVLDISGPPHGAHSSHVPASVAIIASSLEATEGTSLSGNTHTSCGSISAGTSRLSFPSHLCTRTHIQLHKAPLNSVLLSMDAAEHAVDDDISVSYANVSSPATSSFADGAPVVRGGHAHRFTHSGFAYCVGDGGLLRVVSLFDLLFFRSAQLEGDLLCQAALAPSVSGQVHPILLIGSHHRRVHAFGVDAGRLLGSFEAHDDAVCCIAAPSWPAGAPQSRFITSSWDCSVKVWPLSEGRAPWSTGLSLPELELRDFESGVWALAVADDAPGLLATGTEEGVVAVWDVRAGRRAWQVKVSDDDYIGGLSFSPDGTLVTVAAADGRLSMLDSRKSGACVGRIGSGLPLRCVSMCGQTAVAGDEAGALHTWQPSQLPTSTSTALSSAQSVYNGLQKAWQHDFDRSAVHSFAYIGGPAGPQCRYLAAVVQESGRLSLLGPE